MKQDEISRLVREKPFRPFRLHLAGGRVIDVYYPDLHVLGRTFMAIGVAAPNKVNPIGESLEIVLLNDIARAEPLDLASTATS